jgi:hypothetical protein
LTPPVEGSGLGRLTLTPSLSKLVFDRAHHRTPCIAKA